MIEASDPRLNSANQIVVEPPVPGSRRILVGCIDGPPTVFHEHAVKVAKTASALRRDLHDLAGAPLGPLARAEKAKELATAALVEAEALARQIEDGDIGVQQAADSLVSLKPAATLSYSETLIEHALLNRLNGMTPNERAKTIAVTKADPVCHSIWAEMLLRMPVELTGLDHEDRAAIRQRLGEQRDPQSHARIANARTQSALARRAVAALVGIAKEGNADLSHAPRLVALAATSA